MTNLIIIIIFVLLFNIPFGYWRANVRRFSIQWFLAIHIPVPFIVAVRLLSEIGFIWYTYFFLAGGFFLGQTCGSVLMKWLQQHCHQVTSCLVMDLVRFVRS